VQQEGVGLVALQVERGNAPRFAAAGRLRAGQEGGPDEETRFEYGSISKTFTALLLADAVVRGELKLDDAVESLLPQGLKLRDSAGEPLRFIDLATHRSGLPRLPPNIQPREPADPYADYDAAALWAGLEAWRAERRRGERFEYSNLGFGLLGEALARHLKRDFATTLAERVFAPLGLPALVVRTPASTVPRLAQGHDTARGPVPAWRFAVLAGAGAINGSARELARYAQAALGVLDTPLAPAFRLAMRRHAEGPTPGAAIGLAWLLPRVGGRELVNHDGGTFGMSTSLFIDPAAGRAAAVLANAHVPVQDLALHAMTGTTPLRDPAREAAERQAASERITHQAAAAVPADALPALAGRYVLTPQFEITISTRDGRLFAQATAQSEFELFAREAGNPLRWFARAAPIEIDFEPGAGPGAAAAPPAFELRQAGQRLRFARAATLLPR
jgi:CubicO group peptidase (beta-lactamase class C family)